MMKFPSIEQFRTAIKAVQLSSRYVGQDADDKAIYDASRPLPVLRFRGTVKLHGTNAGISYCGGVLGYQSRERVLTLDDDNAGFMRSMLDREAEIYALADSIVVHGGGSADSALSIFGEWCGKGIQKGVAISSLPKMFVVFAVRLDDVWLDMAAVDVSGVSGFYNILDFGFWEEEIDFSRPELAQNRLIEITEGVEARCPAGAHFGVDGVGEGVVWSCLVDGWLSSRFWFKVKGEKHSATKVRVLAAVDVEAMTTIREFVDAVVTEVRLEQGLHVLQVEMLKPFEMTSMGDFIRWVFNDVMKEEGDTILASGIDPKKLGSPIADVARRWFVGRLNSSSS